jgi:hypothetical protein
MLTRVIRNLDGTLIVT